MNVLQIVLISLLVLLGIAFLIALFVKYNETLSKKLFVNKKARKQVEDSLSTYEDIDTAWNNIWTHYYSHGVIKYQKIDVVLSRIINDTQDENIRNKAIEILREKVYSHLFLDDDIAEAIIVFKRTINIIGQHEVKEAGNKLIVAVQRTCKKAQNSQKYDSIIQWLFNAMEIIGFILAIVSLK